MVDEWIYKYLNDHALPKIKVIDYRSREEKVSDERVINHQENLLDVVK
jgi:hypothetical protein